MISGGKLCILNEIRTRSQYNKSNFLSRVQDLARMTSADEYERNKEAANTENRYILTCKNTDKICIFTNKGQMHLLKVLDLPYGKFRDKGTPIDNLSNYNSSEENFVYITNLAAISRSQVLFGTKSAMLKVVDGSEFDVAKRTTAATKLNEGDELIFVHFYRLFVR